MADELGDRCAERSGFLFAHACNQPATTLCATCRKRVCGQHAVMLGGAHYCITCARSDSRFRDDLGGFDSPYFYWHVHSHGGPSFDFTEGDEADVSGGEARREDFENDMGAS